MILTKQDFFSNNTYPMLTLTDTLKGHWGLFSWFVKKHTSGDYSHAMWFVRKGFFAAQDSYYKEIPADNYLSGTHRLKLWYNPLWKPVTILEAELSIQKKLKQPKLQTTYNLLGLIGQLLGQKIKCLRQISFPTLEYCSQSTMQELKILEPNAYKDLGNYPNAAELNMWCENNPEMLCYGIFDPTIKEHNS